jgi:hypothetical protein
VDLDKWLVLIGFNRPVSGEKAICACAGNVRKGLDLCSSPAIRNVCYLRFTARDMTGVDVKRTSRIELWMSPSGGKRA